MLSKRENEIVCLETTRADSSFKELLYATGFASLYRFHNGSWKKVDIEGTFVMYRRRCYPFIGIHVFNRKSLADFCFCVTKNTFVGEDGNLITLQNSKEDGVYGLWFCDNIHPKKILSCMRISL